MTVSNLQQMTFLNNWLRYQIRILSFAHSDSGFFEILLYIFLFSGNEKRFVITKSDISKTEGNQDVNLRPQTAKQSHKMVNFNESWKYA